jgi:tripartite-type tricarboxylate transporter receptor subunit TctC
MERLAGLSGMKLKYIAYKGSAPSILALMGGEINMAATSAMSAIAAIKTGKVKPLATLGLTRLPAMPDLPTVAEQGYPGFNVINWFGSVVRSGTPRGALERLNSEIGRGLQLPEVKETLTQIGMTPSPMSPAEFDAFLRREMETNGKIIRKLGLKVE